MGRGRFRIILDVLTWRLGGAGEAELLVQPQIRRIARSTYSSGAVRSIGNASLRFAFLAPVTIAATTISINIQVARLETYMELNHPQLLGVGVLLQTPGRPV